jgi:ribosomal protein L21E
VGHAGVNKVMYVASENYYWPGMDEDINVHIRGCLDCQLTKGKDPKDRAPFQPSLVGEPFERIAIDISGPFHQSVHGHKYILAIIDYFSKYPVLIPLKRVDAETVAKKTFKYWIAIFGSPQFIHTDRGSNFESDLFREQCAIMGIQKTRTSPYYPQADGLVERIFRTIKPLISATVQSRQIPWCEAIPIVEMGLRCTVQATTGFSPFEIIFGKRMRLPLCWQYPIPSNGAKNIQSQSRYIQEIQESLERIRNEVAYHTRVTNNKQAERYNHKKKAKDIKVGDQVVVKVEGHVAAKFPKMKYSGPYEVVHKNNYWSYKLKNIKNSKLIDRNYNQIKRLEGRDQALLFPSSRDTSIQSLSKKDAVLERRPIVVVDKVNVHQNVPCSSRRYPVRQREVPRRF